MAKNMIQSFEEACEVLGIATKTPDVSALPAKHQHAVVAHYKLAVIAQAMNGGWEPNWNDYDEMKYFPWFVMETYGDAPAGSGFAFGDCGYDRTNSDVGSRLCFKSRALAEHAGKHFLPLYRDCFLIER